MNLNVKQKISLKIKRMGINGEGIGFYKKTLVFVPGAIKGEVVFCQIVRLRSNFAEARLIKVNTVSSHRVKAACPVYDKCGGCQIMHLDYAEQLHLKTDIIKQSLKKFKPSGYEKMTIRETIGMDNPSHYRAKLQFQIKKIKGRVVAGLYETNSHRIVPIKECLVQSPLTQAVMNQVVKLFEDYHFPIQDGHRQKGIRTVMIRQSYMTDEIQMVIITSVDVDLSEFSESIKMAFPEVKSISINLNQSRTSEIYGKRTTLLWGSNAIEEGVLDYHFSLSSRAFYQLNPKQTNVLYQQVVAALDVKKTDHLIDAYCGVGTIGFALANRVKSVRGMDIIPEAIEDAKRNAKQLNFKNTYYEVGAAEDIIPDWYKKGYRADAIIVDPPRTGLDRKLLKTILRYQPSKMVYVSCNASTLARDLVDLTKCYDVEYIQSVDMFPHTARVEAVVKLQKRK